MKLEYAIRVLQNEFGSRAEANVPSEKIAQIFLRFGAKKEVPQHILEIVRKVGQELKKSELG